MTDALRGVIAHKTAERRAALGLSQAELAEASGVSVEFVSRIERARALPSLPTLMRLAHALRCTPNDLLVAERARGGPRSLERLAACLEEATPAVEREVVRVAEALVAYHRQEPRGPKRRRSGR